MNEPLGVWGSRRKGSGDHWTLGVLELKRKIARSYDSMDGEGNFNDFRKVRSRSSQVLRENSDVTGFHQFTTNFISTISNAAGCEDDGSTWKFVKEKVATSDR